MTSDDAARLAERVREALIERATSALEDARLRGLCWEGAWEAAVAAMRAADLDEATRTPEHPPRT